MKFPLTLRSAHKMARCNKTIESGIPSYNSQHVRKREGSYKKQICTSSLRLQHMVVRVTQCLLNTAGQLRI